MNPANLQVEGLCMALASLHRLLMAKGLLTGEEVESMLHFAETTLTGEERSVESLRPASRDAAVFPLRLLRAAARMPMNEPLSFPALTEKVGRGKKLYNDQM
jgi:hypothetical protein